MIEALAARIKEAGANQSALEIRGGGTKRFYGLPAQGTPLDVRAHAGVISYEPTELVLHARSGTRLAEIDALLLECGQELPFEPPCFGEAATLGGCIAAGLAGPSRTSVGPVRDFVLGATLLDGRGEVLHFGGQVMKNVAGYDVSRLLCGSLGTLGVILDVSLKVLPRRAASATRVFELDETQALAFMQRHKVAANNLTATLWHEERCYVRLGGSAASVASAASALGGSALHDTDAARLWHTVREHGHPFFCHDAPLWRLALPPGAPPVGLGPCLMEWEGQLRWIRSEAPAAEIRARATALGGHATLFRASAARRAQDGVFTPLAAPQRAIHGGLKRQFDPHGIFNRGRMYADF